MSVLDGDVIELAIVDAEAAGAISFLYHYYRGGPGTGGGSDDPLSHHLMNLFFLLSSQKGVLPTVRDLDGGTFCVDIEFDERGLTMIFLVLSEDVAKLCQPTSQLGVVRFGHCLGYRRYSSAGVRRRHVGYRGVVWIWHSF